MTSSKIKASEYDHSAASAGWDSPRRAQNLVKDYIHDDAVVLDIGVGTGQAVEGYTEKGATVIGLDHDPDMLKIAQAVTGDAAAMIQADINQVLPIADVQGTVDVVQAIGILEFAQDLSSVIDQIKGVLKPGGHFVFTVEAMTPGAESMEKFVNTDVIVFRHTPDEVRALLVSKGFVIQYDEAYGGYVRDGATGTKVPYHIFLAQI